MRRGFQLSHSCDFRKNLHTSAYVASELLCSGVHVAIIRVLSSIQVNSSQLTRFIHHVEAFEAPALPIFLPADLPGSGKLLCNWFAYSSPISFCVGVSPVNLLPIRCWLGVDWVLIGLWLDCDWTVIGLWLDCDDFTLPAPMVAGNVLVSAPFSLMAR